MWSPFLLQPSWWVVTTRRQYGLIFFFFLRGGLVFHFTLALSSSTHFNLSHSALHHNETLLSATIPSCTGQIWPDLLFVTLSSLHLLPAFVFSKTKAMLQPVGSYFMDRVMKVRQHRAMPLLVLLMLTASDIKQRKNNKKKTLHCPPLLNTCPLCHHVRQNLAVDEEVLWPLYIKT